MRHQSTNSSKSRRAFSLTELIVALATVVLLGVAMVAAQNNTQEQAKLMFCLANVKQVGLALRIWSNDHQEQYPMSAPSRQGGSREAIDQGETFRHVQAVSNELVHVKILVCPADPERAIAKDFAQLGNRNLSYFIGVDAHEFKPEMLMSGDRNVTNGVMPARNLLALSADRPAGWTAALHNERGNLGRADGSAQQATTESLRDRIKKSNAAAPNNVTRIQLPEVPAAANP